MKRDSDFPIPVEKMGSGSVFDSDEVAAWLKGRNKHVKPLGLEDTLWKAADKLRGSMDASEYKHIVLGLVFLKYVDDAFGERRSTWQLISKRMPSLASRQRLSWNYETSTQLKASSGYHPMPAGSSSSRRRSCQKTASHRCGNGLCGEGESKPAWGPAKELRPSQSRCPSTWRAC